MLTGLIKLGCRSAQQQLSCFPFIYLVDFNSRYRKYYSGLLRGNRAFAMFEQILNAVDLLYSNSQRTGKFVRASQSSSLRKSVRSRQSQDESGHLYNTMKTACLDEASFSFTNVPSNLEVKPSISNLASTNPLPLR